MEKNIIIQGIDRQWSNGQGRTSFFVRPRNNLKSRNPVLEREARNYVLKRNIIPLVNTSQGRFKCRSTELCAEEEHHPAGEYKPG
jgi:hypothetical protein